MRSINVCISLAQKLTDFSFNCDVLRQRDRKVGFIIFAYLCFRLQHGRNLGPKIEHCRQKVLLDHILMDFRQITLPLVSFKTAKKKKKYSQSKMNVLFLGEAIMLISYD